ncbi:MAG TPA: extracellular solute-binding protein [Nocardioides sp.]|nr:extracellular solute-binding protein [Nocardioides sp.]
MRHTRGQGVVFAAALTLAGVLAGCGSSNSSSGSSDSITVWSLENQPDRVALTQKIAAGFTQKTGVKVKVVGIDEGQFPQLIATAAESGKMPDVMGALSLGDVREVYQQKLLDTHAAQQVVNDLGSNTFAKSALALTRDGSTQLEVPSDAWAQILVYRKDLFQQAGLQPPTTYAALEHAAQVLTKGGQFGITLATDPSDPFTEQSFESLALGNDCQLIDSSAKVTLDSSSCADSFKLYGTLAQDDSPKGAQTVDTTRATYLAGQSAMVLWSTYILPSLAGLDNGNLPTCQQCRGNKQWLAKNSGIVTAVRGPNGSNAGGYGEIGGWTISSTAQTSSAEKFVEYMMSTGYTQWLGMAPEGKIPVRNGPTAGSQAYVDAWRGLKTGVTSKATLGSIYPASTIDEITGVTQNINRWALPEGQGKILGPLIAQNLIPKVIATLGSGSDTPEQAQQQAQQDVQHLEETTQ